MLSADVAVYATDVGAAKPPLLVPLMFRAPALVGVYVNVADGDATVSVTVDGVNDPVPESAVGVNTTSPEPLSSVTVKLVEAVLTTPDDGPPRVRDAAALGYSARTPDTRTPVPTGVS